MFDGTKFDDLVYKLQDKNIDTKRVIESIQKYVGAVADDINVYLQEELFHCRAAKRTADFAKDELEPLMKDIKASGFKLADVE
jgi:Fe2+ or Zn2+ uptake regulation protein